MNSNTLSLRHTNTHWAAQFNAALAGLAKLAFGPHDAQAERAENSRRLIERADAYAETQPSYAADLRAAALHNIRAD